MANFQIPLNGSNFVNKERQQKFQDALDDQHRIECQDQEQINIGQGSSRNSEPDILNVKDTPPAPRPSQSTGSSAGIEQVLDHTYTHQSRTMEIHQQYLSHQAENVQLITTVLTQQGKVIDSNNGSSQASIIQTFQRTLDNFHALREQSLSVHQQFLAQQAEFSERYLSFLENNPDSVTQSTQAEKRQTAPPAEWVVHVPPIVLDEQTTPEQKTLPDTAVAGHTRVVDLPDEKNVDGITSEELSKALIEIVAEKTGYPSEMLEMDMDMEADLGIDSIKRVEILGALEDDFPSLPPADTEVLSQTRTLQEIVDYMESETNAPSDSDQNTAGAAPSQPQPVESLTSEVQEAQASPAETGSVNLSIDDLTAILLEIVAEKTGYPVEMLEADMDMEADLGIDSIKRVEILGVMEDRVPGLPAVEAETLAELRTLGQIADLMSAPQTSAEEIKPAEQVEKKKVNDVGLDHTPIQLAPLPSPDRMEFLIPEDRPWIITNEGTSFTGQVADLLTDAGWNVAIWNFPTDLISSEDGTSVEGVQHISQTEIGKEAIQTVLDALRKNSGAPVGFIHLHPQANGDDLFSDLESELVKQVFLIAGSIKSDLEQSDPGSRKLFMTVTRTDGTLGLSEIESFQEGSGLTGLVKSLNWEWPEVFCRAVDINRDIESLQASKLIIQEIHDPDLGLLEVGLSSTGRVTLARENE